MTTSLHGVNRPPNTAGQEPPWNTVSELGLRRAPRERHETRAGTMQTGQTLLYHHLLCHRQFTCKKIKLTGWYLKRDKYPWRVLVHSTQRFKNEMQKIVIKKINKTQIKPKPEKFAIKQNSLGLWFR